MKNGIPLPSAMPKKGEKNPKASSKKDGAKGKADAKTEKLSAKSKKEAAEQKKPGKRDQRRTSDGSVDYDEYFDSIEEQPDENKGVKFDTKIYHRVVQEPEYTQVS